MKNRKIPDDKINPTLTQSGLLTMSLQRQRHKVIDLGPASRIGGRCELPFGAVARIHGANARQRFRQALYGTVPRHT